MRTATVVLCVAACAAAVRVGAPAAYVYRSDNGGPPSLFQLGPAPLPYVAALPIAVEDAEEDAERYDGSDDDGGHESGGGGSYEGGHHDAGGEKGSEGYAKGAHRAEGAAGDYDESHDEEHYRQSEGAKGGHRAAADAHGQHHRAGGRYEGADRGHREHFSKGEDVTGYHKVFLKDEFKKDHDFYDEAAKDGHFEKHGYEKAHHGAEKGAHAKGGSGAAGFERVDFGKGGYRAAEREDEAHAEHAAAEGGERRHAQRARHGARGGREHAEHYGHQDDDADY